MRPRVNDLSVLPRYARDVIRSALGGPPAERPQGEVFERPGAAFVTLRWPDGSLQGCIGTLEPRGSLASSVSDGARSAAFHDPRGRRLTLADADALFVEVSVLSRLERIDFTDGVVLRCHGRQGTFLPQMWPRLGDSATFLDELKRKAGFSSRFWSPDIELLRYTVVAFTDGREPPPEVD
jgi:uncharacterized protein